MYHCISHKIPVIPEIGVFATERETDVWISKLWLFYVNRNVLILPRLKYFKSPAATIQASVCQALCLSKSQTQHVKTTNILATWIYFCIYQIIFTLSHSHILVSTGSLYWITEAQYWVHTSERGWLITACVVRARVITHLSSPAHCLNTHNIRDKNR